MQSGVPMAKMPTRKLEDEVPLAAFPSPLGPVPMKESSATASSLNSASGVSASVVSAGVASAGVGVGAGHIAPGVPGAGVSLAQRYPGAVPRRRAAQVQMQQFRDDDDEVVYLDAPKPVRPFPVKAGLVTLFLLAVGLVFSSIGLATSLRRSVSDAVPFLTIGGLALIPGLFHSVLLLCAYLGRPGYTYDMIPSVDDY